MEKALRAFEALIAPLGGEEARRRPGVGEWSVHEVVDHLLVSHRIGLEHLRCLLAGQSPGGGAVPLGLQSEDPFALSWQELRAALGALHDDLLAALAAASDAIPLAATAPVHILLKVPAEGGGSESLDWVQSFDWKALSLAFKVHTLEHVGQVERILAALRGEGQRGA